jgi:hypothetical protein
VDHTADWWLGDLTHPWFLELERAINDEWGAEPMRVREGWLWYDLPTLNEAQRVVAFLILSQCTQDTQSLHLLLHNSTLGLACNMNLQWESPAWVELVPLAFCTGMVYSRFLGYGSPGYGS